MLYALRWFICCYSLRLATYSLRLNEMDDTKSQLLKPDASLTELRMPDRQRLALHATFNWLYEAMNSTQSHYLVADVATAPVLLATPFVLHGHGRQRQQLQLRR